VSYLELQTVLAQKTAHQQFEQLADSQIARQAREKAMRDFARVTNPPVTDPDGWEDPVNSGGIGTINWSHHYGFKSIETQDGQTLYPTPAPSAWLYLFIALLPILGFLIPWGAIRAIGWVGAGFVQTVSHT
jgi:hypothetical protein